MLTNLVKPQIQRVPAWSFWNAENFGTGGLQRSSFLPPPTGQRGTLGAPGAGLDQTWVSGTSEGFCRPPVLTFCSGVSSGYRTVDALLQRMFEADLDLDEVDEDGDGGGSFANPTFGSS